MTRLFTLLILLAVFRAECQTNLFPPPPTPTVISNLQRRLQAPAALRSRIVVEFDYTNISYPFYVSTNLTGGTNQAWTLATNVGCVTVSASFALDPAVAAKFYTVGCPVYYAPAPAGATN